MSLGNRGASGKVSAFDGPILALDTATDEASVVVCSRSKLLAEQRWTSVRRQTVELAPQVRLALDSAGVEPADLAGIAVAIGPGSYTGLRVGLAFAKGLSLVTDTPIVGIPTLDGLALALTRPRAARNAPLVAVLRAGRGRLIGMTYSSDGIPAGDRRIEIESLIACTLDRLASTLPHGAWIAGELDPEQVEWLEDLGFHVIDPSDSIRRGQWLAELARVRLEAGAADDPAALAPIYPGGRAVPGPQPSASE